MGGDDAELIRIPIGGSLNSTPVGTLCAGGVEKEGIERYMPRAKGLGKKLEA